MIEHVLLIAAWVGTPTLVLWMGLRLGRSSPPEPKENTVDETLRRIYKDRRANRRN